MRFYLPVFLLALFAPFSVQLDIAASSYFFNPESGHFSSIPLWDFFYNWGTLPALLTAVAALALLAVSLFVASLIRFRKALILVVLTLTLGSGLIVHGLLKDHWSRPRPRQTVLFGGPYPFVPFYVPHFSGTTKAIPDEDLPASAGSKEVLRSFPCGHCTMGFFFFALMFAFRRHEKKSLAALALGLALILGFFLSLSRIAVGGHFLSDTLVSLAIMWLTAALLDHYLFRKHPCPV
ncbi:phosphatase PAP2 family protein [Estrella lausannensis]|uniref:Phosphatidic acid phosphatase type 2/haloperoxidase domain-containing protein n=1 Tax=Estrella lausannensis TaxID=483423 RepID=A0A0H5DQB8_9BACT|nr:phosphatase PAP2 family protein [Estrella lausannensis]CRX37739.1 conserved hypothetical protein [Estrella lausannensis]